MSRHDLAGRLRRVERSRPPADSPRVWWPDPDRDDGLVRDGETGETIPRAEVGRRPGRHIVVEYDEGTPACDSPNA